MQVGEAGGRHPRFPRGPGTDPSLCPSRARLMGAPCRALWDASSLLGSGGRPAGRGGGAVKVLREGLPPKPCGHPSRALSYFWSLRSADLASTRAFTLPLLPWFFSFLLFFFERSKHPQF